MGVNSLPKTVTRQRRSCDFNPGPTAPESSTLTTRLPSTRYFVYVCKQVSRIAVRNAEISSSMPTACEHTCASAADIASSSRRPVTSLRVANPAAPTRLPL